MGEFLGLGDAELRLALFRQDLAEDQRHLAGLLEGDREAGEVFEGFVVGGHADVAEVEFGPAVETFLAGVGRGRHVALEIGLHESTGDLAGAVAAVVVEDDGVAVLDAVLAFIAFAADGPWGDEFVAVL